jgi:glycosyltransferase involved in cell wall biosynthesis
MADDRSAPVIRRRLLTIGHSYCVGVNRRLAHEIARTGDWDVTVAAPTRFPGDFGVHTLTPEADEPCTLVPVPVYFGAKVHLMVYGRRLRALLRQPWDVVHCWEEPYVAAAAQVAAWTPPRVPLVFAAFQNIDKRYPPPFRWFEQYATSRAAGLVAFGQTVLRVATAHGFPAAWSRIIPPGVDTVRFAPDAVAGRRIRRSVGWDDDVPVVGFLGRFVPEKGLMRLTAALDRLHAPWRALLVGAGPLERELRRWAGPYGDRVAIVTTVTHGEVPAWLNAMDLLCAPSQSTARWREQFGRMLIEAFAAGVPVVASDSGEIPHVVGDAGLLLPENDALAWERALSTLLANRDLRRELAGRGRARALARYDWPVVARQHARFFSDVVEGAMDRQTTRLPAMGGVSA